METHIYTSVQYVSSSAILQYRYFGEVRVCLDFLMFIYNHTFCFIRWKWFTLLQATCATRFVQHRVIRELENNEFLENISRARWRERLNIPPLLRVFFFFFWCREKLEEQLEYVAHGTYKVKKAWSIHRFGFCLNSLQSDGEEQFRLSPSDRNGVGDTKRVYARM